MEKSNKNKRILEIYSRLCEGEGIHKSEESNKFHVDGRTIQRDIDDIRAFLNEHYNGLLEVKYDVRKRCYFLHGDRASQMTNSEILAITKILLESRAFTKKEMDNILNKMVAGCVPYKNMKLVTDLIANEKYHYVELHHKATTNDILWKFGETIRDCDLVEIMYRKADNMQEFVTRIIEPVALLFSEYYFYLGAYIVELDENTNRYMQIHDYPTIFRLDRIESYKKLEKKFKIPYASRFEEGEFRKRVQFMYPGKLMKIQFKYFGINPEPILDRLPTARILSQKNDSFLIEAETYGNGIMMWILSQGNKIEVIKPKDFRDDIKKELTKMFERY